MTKHYTFGGRLVALRNSGGALSFLLQDQINSTVYVTDAYANEQATISRRVSFHPTGARDCAGERSGACLRSPFRSAGRPCAQSSPTCWRRRRRWRPAPTPAATQPAGAPPVPPRRQARRVWPCSGAALNCHCDACPYGRSVNTMSTVAPARPARTAAASVAPAQNRRVGMVWPSAPASAPSRAWSNCACSNAAACDALPHCRCMARSSAIRCSIPPGASSARASAIYLGGI